MGNFDTNLGTSLGAPATPPLGSEGAPVVSPYTGGNNLDNSGFLGTSGPSSPNPSPLTGTLGNPAPSPGFNPTGPTTGTPFGSAVPLSLDQMLGGTSPQQGPTPTFRFGGTMGEGVNTGVQAPQNVGAQGLQWPQIMQMFRARPDLFSLLSQLLAPRRTI